MDGTASSAYGFALHEMGFTDFNDERLTQRAVKITAQLLQHPQGSIPQACGSWKDTKAFYRFLDNSKVTSENMFSSHLNETINRCKSLDKVLISQDTTVMNLSNKQVSGLGRIGMGDLSGFFTHSALAMNCQGTPLGLLYQKTYVRKVNTQDKEYRKVMRKLPILEKETGKWVEVVDCVRKYLPDKEIVVIGDRESDIFDVFKKAQELRVNILIRTSQNRLIVEDSGAREHLFDKIKSGEIIASYITEVPTSKYPHKTREANLTIRTVRFMLPIAKNRRKEKLAPIPVTLIDVVEEDPPEEEEGIHWTLTTTLAVSTQGEVVEKVKWYMYRWRIERFHYILKTGAFNVEKLQFETFDKFKKAISIYSIISWRILYTSCLVREQPNMKAEEVFSKEEVEVLIFRQKRSLQTLTIQEAVLETAKLGGFLGRKGDGNPGVKSLWLGFQVLQYLVEGMLLGKKMFQGTAV